MQRKFLLPFLFVFVFFCSQGVVLAEEIQNQTLQTLSQEIHTQLENLKQQSRHLTEQLAIAENELQTSSKRVEELQMELRGLNTSLENTNQKLSDYSVKLTEYELKLKTRAKIIMWTAALLILGVIVRVILLVLKIKFNIKIPYLLNLLL